MSDKVTYEFAIIRLVPKVERGECLNVGVILFSKSKRFLDMKYQVDCNRIQAFSPKVDCEEIEDYLKTWAMVCAGKPRTGTISQLDVPSRFRWLTAARSTIIQCSSVHPGLCNDPQYVLGKLFNKYVA